MTATSEIIAAVAAATRARIDGPGPSGGAIWYYTAPRPATGSAPTGATLVAVHTLTRPCGVASASGLVLNAPPADATCLASGTVAWARVVDAYGVALYDLRAGLASDPAAELVLDSLDAQAGGKIKLLSGAFV